MTFIVYFQIITWPTKSIRKQRRCCPKRYGPKGYQALGVYMVLPGWQELGKTLIRITSYLLIYLFF